MCLNSGLNLFKTRLIILKFASCCCVTIMHYDGMPLNIGTFPRQDKGEIFFDGVIPKVSLEKMRELVGKGNVAVHNYISESCSWISEVAEFDMCDASGRVHVNVFTNFGTSAGDAEGVKGTLEDVMSFVNACSNCITEGEAKNCSYVSMQEPCNKCKITNAKECVSAMCIHVSSDQATSQRKAHIELNKVAANDFNNPSYKFYGFGLLHFCKNCISSLRHYRLTDMSETFYVGLLSAVWASNTTEAMEMKKVSPAAVFSFRDAHSDEICYQTVSKPLQDILQETGSIVATLVPEQYKPTCNEAKTHAILGHMLTVYWANCKVFQP